MFIWALIIPHNRVIKNSVSAKSVLKEAVYNEALLYILEQKQDILILKIDPSWNNFLVKKC